MDEQKGFKMHCELETKHDLVLLDRPLQRCPRIVEVLQEVNLSTLCWPANLLGTFVIIDGVLASRLFLFSCRAQAL